MGGLISPDEIKEINQKSLLFCLIVDVFVVGS